MDVKHHKIRWSKKPDPNKPDGFMDVKTRNNKPVPNKPYGFYGRKKEH